MSSPENKICIHWSPCKVAGGGGCCALEVYGPKVSYGVCLKSCTHRVPVQLTIEGKSSSEITLKDVPPPSLPAKVASYLSAELDLAVFGPLGDEEFEARMAQCRSCPRLQPSSEPSQVGWCKACGCGTRARAELTIKGRMRKATCPLSKWSK